VDTIDSTPSKVHEQVKSSDFSFPRRSPSENTRNITYPPLVPYQNNTLPLQQGQSCNINAGVDSSQQQSNTAGMISSNPIATAYRNYHKIAGPSASVSSPNTYKSVQNQQQASPLMAAPKLLPPNSKQKEHEAPMLLSRTVDDNLQPMQREQKRQRVQENNQSRLQILQEAYFTSVSPNKSPHSKEVKTNGNMLAASPKLPSQLVKATHDSTESRRITASQYHNNMTTNSIQAQSQSTKNIVSGAQSSAPTEISPDFDWNPMVDDPSKQETNVPNFLSGFDKLSNQKVTNPFDQTAPNDTSFDLQEEAQFSPAYHTSKSFDDFHRFLGKGLPPAVPPPPRFPTLRTTIAGPAIPSIESSDKARISNLQMRPQNQRNLASAVINSEIANSVSPSKIEQKMSNQSILSEAFAEVVRTSPSEKTVQTIRAKYMNDINSSNRYNVRATNHGLILNRNSMHVEKGKKRSYQSDQAQQRPDAPSDYPLDGMMFEDFGTLASCPDMYATFRDQSAAVSDPSDDSEGPHFESGGGGMSDDSDGTQLEEILIGPISNNMG
jgi:hypothetical protein